MDLQVCAPKLATASPSAIAGCVDKLEFCKVLYVPIGGPARRCAALQSLLHLMIQTSLLICTGNPDVLAFADWGGC